jgi:uncharacterized membrane protein YdjX (TVP38/TMEM64 family)
MHGGGGLKLRRHPHVKKVIWVRLFIVLLAAGGVWLLSRSAVDAIPELTRWVADLGHWGPLVFGLLYATGTILFVPGALLTLAAGALFGVLEGTLVVWLSAMLGSSGSFLIARYGARGWVEKKLGQSKRFEAVDRAVAEHGLKITFLLRLSPAFPFSLSNYALGLTRVSFRDYCLAGFGMLPGSILYVYYGNVIGTVAKIATQTETPKDSGYYIVMAIGLVATLLVTTLVTRIARRALADATGPE